MTKNIATIGGLTSIIIPCWNQLDFTRLCVRAVMRHTRWPWELIVINNGSTDRTADYLAGLQDASPVPVTVIANSINRGFPAAINQGLQEARGEYLVLLNSDVVVTDGWLEQLVALTCVRPESPQVEPLLARCPPPFAPPLQGGERCAPLCGRDGTARVGLAGPMSNYAAPPQLVADVPYHDMEEMDVFARNWRDQHRGKWFTVSKLSGFCLLMKRAVYEKIGGLDERFGLGFFDDDDLAERARRAGFGLAVAHDLFVHHFGSRTFVCNGVDAEGLLDENARRFADKWGLAEAHGRRVVLRPFAGSWQSNAESAHSAPTGPLTRPSADLSPVGRGGTIPVSQRREEAPGFLRPRPNGERVGVRGPATTAVAEKTPIPARSASEGTVASRSANHNSALDVKIPRSRFGLVSTPAGAFTAAERGGTISVSQRREEGNVRLKPDLHSARVGSRHRRTGWQSVPQETIACARGEINTMCHAEA
jgi:GT2 family glycosyltransferase